MVYRAFPEHLNCKQKSKLGAEISFIMDKKLWKKTILRPFTVPSSPYSWRWARRWWHYPCHVSPTSSCRPPPGFPHSDPRPCWSWWAISLPFPDLRRQAQQTRQAWWNDPQWEAWERLGGQRGKMEGSGEKVCMREKDTEIERGLGSKSLMKEMPFLARARW